MPAISKVNTLHKLKVMIPFETVGSWWLHTIYELTTVRRNIIKIKLNIIKHLVRYTARFVHVDLLIMIETN